METETTQPNLVEQVLLEQIGSGHHCRGTLQDLPLVTGKGEVMTRYEFKDVKEKC